MKKKTVLAAVLALLVVSILSAAGAPEVPQIISSSFGKPSSSSSSSSRNGTKSDQIDEDMERIEYLYRYIDTYFYQDVDYQKAYEAMATALFESLGDKYSYYIVAEDKDDYVETALGKYGGLGLYFSKTYIQYQNEGDPTTLYCVIDRVFPNTPCSRAGLRSDDLIIAIDDTDVIPLEATECARMMKGDPGTTVKLTVRRGEQTFELVLTREMVNVPTVQYTTIEDGTIGFIEITEFTSSTWNAFVSAILEFTQADVKGIIIDLRSNGGGDISVALSIADSFIRKGDLLTVTYKGGEKDVYTARTQTLVPSSVKVALLVNGSSASSSEILTGAMKDNGRAKIIGTQTYGKGIMQAVTSYGDGYISLTEASFTTSGREAIHGVGIEPDIEVPELVMTEEEAEAYTAIYNDRIIAKYVDEHPDFTDENIEAFAIDTEKYGEIRHEVLRVLVRYEYINRLPGDQQFIIDPDYDDCVRAAIEYINGD